MAEVRSAMLFSCESIGSVDGQPGGAMRKWRLWYVAAALLFLLLMSTVPYHVPLRPSVSDSWIFGYNNRAGTVLTGLAALLLGFFGRELPRRSTFGKSLTSTTLWKVLLLTLLLVIVDYLFYGNANGASEGVYIVDRTGLLLEGKRPYLDFSFAYGLSLLYIPAFFVRALSLSVAHACFLSWGLIELAGMAELYFVLRWTEWPAAAQRITMLYGVSLALIASIGLSPSYTVFRFLTSGFLAMALVRALRNARTERAYRLLLLLTIPSAFACLALSPEVGVAYIAGIVLFLALFGKLRSFLNALFFAAALLGMASCLYAFGKIGAFRELRSFSAGGYNYPITPAPHLLALFAAIAVVATYVGARLRRREGTPLMALCCISAVMLPGALGRCDPIHVQFDELGIFLCASLIVLSSGRWSRYIVAGGFFLLAGVSLVLHGRSVVAFFGDPAAAMLLRSPAATEHSWRFQLASFYLLHAHHRADGEALLLALPKSKLHTDPVDVATVFHSPSSTVFQAPFAFFANTSGPYHSPNVDPGYFISLVDVTNTQDVDVKIAELTGHPDRPLLMPPGAENACTIHEANALAEIHTTLQYPYRAKQVHPGDVMEPFCSFIRSHYHQQQPATQAHFGYSVWENNSTR